MEKHIEIQKDLFHNFIDLKKAFDRVWHQGIWQVMENVGISDGITQLIKSLYKSSTSVILLDNIKGDYFKTTVGLRRTLYGKVVSYRQFFSTFILNKLCQIR